MWTKFENSVNTSRADDRYFEWYQALDGIGNGALTRALKKKEILYVEHCTRDTFEEYCDEHGTKDLWGGVSLAMCMTAEVLVPYALL